MSSLLAHRPYRGGHAALREGGWEGRVDVSVCGGGGPGREGDVSW